MARKRQRRNRDNAGDRQPAGSSWAPDHPELAKLLAEAEVVGCRPIMWGSNGTFLLSLDGRDAGQSHAVYKPRRGESPLWDFPRGTLYRREMATFLVSECLGWSLVPPTVIRDGPYGVGSVQLFIEHDPDEYFVPPVRRDREAAAQIALLDVILNNADRKTEHCLRDLDGRMWAIDHGLTFHTDPKLRTVIWDFAGDVVPDEMLADLERLCQALEPCGALHTQLRGLVSQAEADGVLQRLRRILHAGVYPDPGAYRRAVPWGAW